MCSRSRRLGGPQLIPVYYVAKRATGMLGSEDQLSRGSCVGGYGRILHDGLCAPCEHRI
jgi:hypothetical protein